VFDGAGNQTHRYLYGTRVDTVLADETATQVLWALADNQGTIRDVLDGNGTILNHVTYDSFGKVVGQSNAGVEFRYGYTGREADGETGLDYYRARYYDASNGRFISEDPLGFGAGDGNLSRYVGNSPTNWNDPSGLLCGAAGDGGFLGPMIDFGELVGGIIYGLSHSAPSPFVDRNPPPPPLPPFPNPTQPNPEDLNTGHPTSPSPPEPLIGYPSRDPLDRNRLHTGNTNNPDNLFIPVFQSQHGKGNKGDSGIRQDAQDRIKQGDFDNIEDALKQMMKDAKNANNGRPDTDLVNRIKSEQKAQGDRHSRQSKDKKK
jgi:RHS repeat-associated protein